MAHSSIEKLLRAQPPALLQRPHRHRCTVPEAVFGEPVDDAAHDLRPGSKHQPGHVQRLRFNRAPLDAMRPGAVLVIRVPLLGGTCRLQAIDVVGDVVEGRVLRGRVLEDPQLRASTLTLGKERVYGTLVTPLGTLELEARDDIAWIFVSPHSEPGCEQRAWLLPGNSSQA